MQSIKENRDSIYFGLLALINFYMFLPFAAQSILILLIIGIGFVFSMYNRKWNTLGIFQILWILPLVISLLYSTNFDDGFKIIKTLLAFAALNTVYFQLKKEFTTKYIKKIALSFCIANAIFLVVVVAYLYFKTFTLSDFLNFELNQNALRKNHFVLYAKSTPFHFHKTYFALSISVAFLLLHEVIVKVKWWISLGLYLFMIYSFYIKGSHVGIMASLVALVTYLTYKYWKFMIPLGILFLVILYQYKTPILNKLEERGPIYTCSIDLIKSANPFLGLGVGTVQEKLNDCYKEGIKSNYELFKHPVQESLNTHNQFLFMYLSAGIFCLLLYLLSMYIDMKTALRYMNIYLIAFLVVINVYYLVENVLTRVNGAIIMGISNSLFLIISTNRYNKL